jgi:hypothetical protein
MYHCTAPFIASASFLIAQLTLLGLVKPALCACEDDLLHEVGSMVSAVYLDSHAKISTRAAEDALSLLMKSH